MSNRVTREKKIQARWPVIICERNAGQTEISSSHVWTGAPQLSDIVVEVVMLMVVVVVVPAGDDSDSHNSYSSVSNPWSQANENKQKMCREYVPCSTQEMQNSKSIDAMIIDLTTIAVVDEIRANALCLRMFCKTRLEHLYSTLPCRIPRMPRKEYSRKKGRRFAFKRGKYTSAVRNCEET